MRVSIAYVVLGVLILSGCVSPYKRLAGISLFGGFKDEELSSGIYRVSFYGNGYTSLDRARLCVMYRCAELTLEKGCDYYQELDDEQIKSSLPTLIVSPGGTFGAPNSHHVVSVIRVFKGDRPAGDSTAKSASAVKAEIEPVLFPKK